MTFRSGDIFTVDFPGITGIKRRPVVVLSSAMYHTARPDVIVGLITSQTKGLGSTDYPLKDWQSAGLRVESIFRSFIVTLPQSANFVHIGQLSEQDWQGVRNRVKLSFAELDISEPRLDLQEDSESQKRS